MKIFIPNVIGESGSVLDKCDSQRLSSVEDADIVFAPIPVMDVSEGKIEVNTSTAVRTLYLDLDAKKKLFSTLGLNGTKPSSVVYGVTDSKRFSSMIEVCFSDRFMNDDVGPRVGMTIGIGMLPPYDIDAAVPNFSKIKKLVEDLSYRGEVAIGIGSDFTIVSVEFGHIQPLFSMFAEICKFEIADIIEFCAGGVFEDCTVWNSIVSACFVTRPPFPGGGNIPLEKIRAPANAEKHIWRLLTPSGEACLVTTHGRTFRESRYRTYRTINNMLKFTPDLQFRTDLGKKTSFILSRDKFASLYSDSTGEPSSSSSSNKESSSPSSSSSSNKASSSPSSSSESSHSEGE